MSKASPMDQLTQKQVAVDLLKMSYDSFRVRRSADRAWFIPPEGHLGQMPWWYRWQVEQWMREHDWEAERSA